MRIEGCRIWITGASSGIGRAVALQMAREGARLVLSARRTGLLEEVAQECLSLGAKGALALPADLSDPAALPSSAAEAWKAFDGLDVVFCNAGISQRGLAADTSEEVMRRVMETDFFAPAQLMRLLVPLMSARGGGRIAITSSIAGRIGVPLRSSYSAAKHALEGFAESLEAEYAQDGIRVLTVVGGRIRTEVSLHALEGDGREHGTMDPGQAGGISPERAARRIVRALRRERREVWVGSKELAILPIYRLFPRIGSRIVGKRGRL